MHVTLGQRRVITVNSYCRLSETFELFANYFLQNSPKRGWLSTPVRFFLHNILMFFNISALQSVIGKLLRFFSSCSFSAVFKSVSKPLFGWTKRCGLFNKADAQDSVYTSI